MEGFEYFRSTEPRFIPKTSSAALKALFSQLLPEEAFIYLGTSAQSLDEEPVDLEALERMLSRSHLDLETNRMLRHILNRLVKSSDPETALFAAESIVVECVTVCFALSAFTREFLIPVFIF